MAWGIWATHIRNRVYNNQQKNYTIFKIKIETIQYKNLWKVNTFENEQKCPVAREI